MLMEFGIFPWYRVSLVVVALCSWLYMAHFLPLAIKHRDHPESPWVMILALLFSVQALMLFHALSLTNITLYNQNLYWRSLNLSLIFFCYTKLMEKFSHSGNSFLFFILRLCVCVVILALLFGGLQTFIVIQDLYTYKTQWGEQFTATTSVRKPLFWIIHVLYQVLNIACLYYAVKLFFQGLRMRSCILFLFVISTSYISYFNYISDFGKAGISLIPHHAILVLILISLSISTESFQSKKLMKMLANQNQQMQNMAQHVPGVLFSILFNQKNQFDILFLSQNIYKFFGFDNFAPNAINLLQKGLSSEDRERYHLSFLESIRTLSQWKYVAKFHRLDGSVIWFQGISEPIQMKDGILFNGVLIDITQRMHDQIERESLLSELYMRKDELETMLSALSHDFRVPLVNIGGFCGELNQFLHIDLSERLRLQNTPSATISFIEEAIKNDADLPLQIIQTNQEKLSTLINSLLQVLRNQRDHLNIDEIDFETVVREAIEILKDSSSENIFLEIPEKLPICQCDSRQLAIVLYQLVSNSIYYRHPERPCTITITAAKTNEQVQYRISDHGIGFPPELSERIFQVFYRIHPEMNSQGQGIGLGVARQAMLRMGGTISAEGSSDGATFILNLPMASKT